MSGATGAAAPPALTGLQNPYSFLDVRDQIGKGAYGKVFKCVLNNVKQLVAVKVVPIVEEEEDAIALELQVLASHSSHRNIARFYGAYADYGPKDDFLGDGKPQLWLAPRQAAAWARRFCALPGGVCTHGGQAAARRVTRGQGSAWRGPLRRLTQAARPGLARRA